jgi:phospholipid/cholesterol/gamma-HCH transport system substrate-binding protein
MGPQRNIAVYAGIFVIAGLTILMWLSLKVEGVTLGVRTYTLRAEFDSVLGLSPGNPVTFRGVEIGRVGESTIDTRTGQPSVTILINERWPLHENAVARLVLPDFFGRKAIDISYPEGGPQGRQLTAGDMIRTEQTTDLATALSNLGDLSGDVRHLITSIDENQQRAFSSFSDMIDENRPRVGAILASAEITMPRIDETVRTIGDVAGRIRDGNGTMARLVNDPELAENLSQGVANFRAVTQRLSSGEGTLGRLVQDEDIYSQLQVTMGNLQDASEGLRDLFSEENGTVNSLGQLADDLHETMPDLRETLANAREITDKINSGQGTIGLLINDPTLYNELRQALRRIGETFEEAEETGVVRTFLSVFFGAFI